MVTNIFDKCSENRLQLDDSFNVKAYELLYGFSVLLELN